MAVPTLSTLATFDDIRRCIHVLTDGTAEEEFLRVLKFQERFRQECLSSAQEAQRIQKELDASLQNMADLETKLFHARRLLEMESKARREAEYERDQMEKKIVAVADLLQNERNLKDETKDKLAFLNTLPRKRKSANRRLEEKYGNDINSTGSFLSDLSITQSEDDFLDVHQDNHWKKHRPSLPKSSGSRGRGSTKRSRLSGHGAKVTTEDQSTPHNQKSTRSGTQRGGVNTHILDIGPSDKICATTKVTIPQDGLGPIRAESTIESVPAKVISEVAPVEDVVEEVEEEMAKDQCIGDGLHQSPKRSPFKEATAPQMTPISALKHCALTNNIMGSPAQNLRSNLMRQHNFTSKTFIRTDTCTHCQKKIRFGAVALRCRDCPIRCHTDCRYQLTAACVPKTGTPTTKGIMGYISDYAPGVAPMIPGIIVHCVNEIESRGLNEVGIYRVPGAEREVKALKERFLRGKGTPHLSNIDVHVLCGCVKDFLRSFREPLIPTELWKDFCNAVQNPSSKQDIQKDLFKAIAAMPQANRDTLAFLILHFQRIAESPDVRMPIENIARVFGPTIVGYSTLDPDQHAIFTEVFPQFSVMKNLMEIDSSYWLRFVEPDVDKENNLIENVALTDTPIHNNNNNNYNKDYLHSLYATPLKSTTKKRKIHAAPPYSHKK